MTNCVWIATQHRPRLSITADRESQVEVALLQGRHFRTLLKVRLAVKFSGFVIAPPRNACRNARQTVLL